MDRPYIALHENWKFPYGEEPQAWYKGYDDSAWMSVTLPHDWSVHMPFEQTNSSGTGYLSGGIGWYRVRFSLPEAYKGKRVRVVFDGIYKNSSATATTSESVLTAIRRSAMISPILSSLARLTTRLRCACATPIWRIRAGLPVLAFTARHIL